MAEKIFAVLLDVVSIQKYVFSSNKLLENLGASMLVEEVYNSILKEAYGKVFKGINLDLESWKKEDNKISLPEKPIGFIGGGNALIFFKDEESSLNFIKSWTKLLLIKAPGIETAVAYNEFDLDKFSQSKKALFEKLRDNKNRYRPPTVIPRHGINSVCSKSGYSGDILLLLQDKKEYISSVSYAKIKSAGSSGDNYNYLIPEDKRDKFTFTNSLEDLGQTANENSYIAIVHIDGNNMGARFQEINTLAELANLATTVQQATINSFKALIEHIIKEFTEIEKELSISEESNKKVLPIRPIIIGGDDITFVCDGRYGNYFSKIFIEAFEGQKVSDGKKLTACAGVAITKTKYPFYRGYKMAEELCSSAKKLAKKESEVLSAIDFQISQGGISGNIEDIRKKYFNNNGNKLCFRPYILNNEQNGKSFSKIIRATYKLKKDFPNSKIKELRQVLSLGKDSATDFVNEQKYRQRTLPELQGTSYHLRLFENTETPYFDMIELMEFYPSYVLDKEKNQ